MVELQVEGYEQVNVEPSECDLKEEKVTEYLQKGCGCRQACYKLFTRDHIKTNQENTLQLSWHELNLGQIMASTFCSSSLVRVEKHHHAAKDRERCSMAYYHQGHRICRTTFCFLHGISEERLRNLKAHYTSSGLVQHHHVIPMPTA